jgi:hypothetical protein
MPNFSAIRAHSANGPARIFCMTPLRWILTVNSVVPSLVHRDEVNAEVMKDPRLAKMDGNEVPFDCKRMAYGGFRSPCGRHRPRAR